MKKNNIISILLIITFIMGSCTSNRKLAESKSSVYPLSDAGVIKDGSIVYGLPRTVFTIVVEMGRTIEKPGPYSKYAGDLLGLDDVIKNETEYWTIENVSVKSNEELDPSEFYIIKSNSLFQTNVLALKKEGLILDLNPENFHSADMQAGIKETENNDFRSFDLGSDEYFQLQRDTAYKRVNLDSSFIRIPYIVEKKRKLTADQLAEKAARRLMEMRDGMHLILTGEANVFPQSDAAINEINRMEKEYTELFTGKTLKDTRTFIYQIVPTKEMTGKPVTLFQFSDLIGPLNGNMKGGLPVTIELIPEQKTKDLTILKNVQADPDAPVFDKIFYRVPDVANLKISMGPEILYSSRKLVYQFGQVVQLPANYIIGK